MYFVERTSQQNIKNGKSVYNVPLVMGMIPGLSLSVSIRTWKDLNKHEKHAALNKYIAVNTKHVSLALILIEPSS